MMELKAGDVLFFNGSVIHGSTPNTSADRFRRSLIFHYVPASTVEISHWYEALSFDGERQDIAVNMDGGPCGHDAGDGPAGPALGLARCVLMDERQQYHECRPGEARAATPSAHRHPSGPCCACLDQSRAGWKRPRDKRRCIAQILTRRLLRSVRGRSQSRKQYRYQKST